MVVKMSDTKKEFSQLSSFLKRDAAQFFTHPFVKNTRILVVVGRDRPSNVIPYFQQALQSNVSELINAATMEINTLSTLHFEKLTDLYDQIFVSDNINAHWLAILNLLNLRHI